MLDTKAAIKTAYIVGKLIYDQVQLVKANQAQRIMVAVSSIHGLEKAPDKDRYTVALNSMVNPGSLHEHFLTKA